MEEYFPEPRRSQMATYLRQFARGFGIPDLETSPRLSNTKRILAMAEYARDQGRLVEFRDAGMEAYWRGHTGVESDAELRAIAEAAGLNPDEALAAADSPKYRERNEQVATEAKQMGVTGIPTFFIGNHKVVGCQPYEVLARAAEAAGARKRDGG